MHTIAFDHRKWGARPPRNGMELDHYGIPIQILIDPSERQIENFVLGTTYKAARRLVDNQTGTVYIWDGGDPMLHAHLAQMLGVQSWTGDVIAVD